MNGIKRDTNEDLMNNVFELVKKNHCYDRAEKIIDYFLPETFTVMKLSDCEFDFDANVQFGINEGIYIDCSIRGHFDENEPSDKTQIIHCGTFKTLGTSNEDPMETLSKLKKMLDAGFIEQEEYDKKKKEILSRM